MAAPWSGDDDVGEWTLVASVVFAGLWSGLLAMLTMVMHPMLRAMDGRDFARFLRAFLPPARHAHDPWPARLVSNRLAEPNYDVMLAWDPDAMPSGWEATRKYYFTLNWIRAFATSAAFGLFLAALVDVS